MKLLRLSEVKARTGLSKSTIYQYITEEKFPRQVKIGARACAWTDRDIDQWIHDRINQSINHDYSLKSI